MIILFEILLNFSMTLLWKQSFCKKRQTFLLLNNLLTVVLPLLTISGSSGCWDVSECVCADFCLYFLLFFMIVCVLCLCFHDLFYGLYCFGHVHMPKHWQAHAIAYIRKMKRSFVSPFYLARVQTHAKCTESWRVYVLVSGSKAFVTQSKLSTQSPVQ